MTFDGQDGAMLEGIGPYGYERRVDKRIRSRCNDPYPREFDRGIIETMARRFRADAEVTHRLDARCPPRYNCAHIADFAAPKLVACSGHEF